MIKANIIVQVVDENNIYNIGDKVRVLMKPLTEQKSGYEYIGKIVDIQETFMSIFNDDDDCKVLPFGSIDRMRLARDGENFLNTWNFDD